MIHVINRSIRIKKGVFGVRNYSNDRAELIAVCVSCDKDGNAIEPVEFSSKSGENFNHKLEWKKLKSSVTSGHSFDYYPRGRVEIKSSKAMVFLNPTINNEDITSMIIEKFGLSSVDLTSVKFKSDGSRHYRFTSEGE